MKGESWLKYLIYAVLIAAMVMLNVYIEEKFQRGRMSDGRYPIACMVISIVTGLLLGGEYLFSEMKKEGKWKINLPKIILTGLPALYFSFSGFALDNPLWSNMIKYLIYYANDIGGIVSYWTGYVRIFQVILGYVVITSLYKRTKNALHNQIPAGNI